jgi:DNA invertase Pin-like site-specific DNA recombinase
MCCAYIRVSSVDQNTARQEDAFSKAGFQIHQTYIKQASAKDANPLMYLTGFMSR